MKIKFKLKLIFVLSMLLILIMKYIAPILTLEELEESGELFLD